MAIHLFHEHGEYAIWSDTEAGEYHTGRCIGIAATLKEAIADAQQDLREDLARVQALSDGDVVIDA